MSSRLRRALRCGAGCVLVATAFAGSPDFGNLGQPTEVHCKDETLLASYYGLFNEIWISRRMDRVERWVDPDFTGPEPAPGGVRGPAVIRGFESFVSSAFPRRMLFNDLMLCADNIIASYQTVLAINDGPFLGQPPSGRLTRVTWTDTYRFREGKVYQTLASDGDSLGTRMQVGWRLVPPGGTAPLGTPVPWVDYYPYAPSSSHRQGIEP
jgi:hypothetical protein